ncbi:V-type ATP synthase subunit I [Aerococcus kribbianus]|uniref:ATPase n=1 Tax=Aerococcus kribbianus TaxID=2999064 RepID=A0A9X3FUB4_9LACT|nr:MULTISPECIES: V-type ATPase 116kDa subunit family protein [unclassified Aerococcus]MCZ0717026.1 ATPase [Aerococcus sp. YH-aer221]MCZ0725314.1 ATPase [Aerococcus sp. YH-aer222]
MITKMTLVNITGPRDDIDRMADQYLSHYEIHLVNALKELSEISTLKPYTSPNPYEPWLEKIAKLLDLTHVSNDHQHLDRPYSFEQAKNLVTEIDSSLVKEQSELEHLQAEYDDAKAKADAFAPFIGINFPMEKILAMSHIKFRFGRFTKENYLKFKKYIDRMVPSIFVPAKEVDGYVYGVYFTPVESRQRVDALYLSLAWERIYLPEETGTLKSIYQAYSNQAQNLNKQIKDSKMQLRALITPVVPDLMAAQSRLEDLSRAYGVRKYAAITREEFAQKETRYLLIGWMEHDDAIKLEHEVADDESISMYIEDDEDNKDQTPPTKMKNNLFVRPFELLTKMYGVPNYREMDPTILVALTYTLLFGAMFGDVGQGLILFLVGLIGVFNPKLRPLGMLSAVGLSSTFFGFLYGSIFGFEDVLPALWLRPMAAMTEIPFFGRLNTVFIVAVCFGLFLIILTMTMNIIQEFKNGNRWNALLDKNGLAGLIFYGTMVLILVLYMTNNPIPASALLVAILAISLAIIAFKEQIIAKLEDKKEENGDSLVIELLTVFFETFETLLTYFSNSISFVRVGAFAISHGAMMGVVLMFAGAENGGSINWLVILLGNLFVIGFEGLVVAIQVLRLEFYEIFSHFYKGDGIEFKNTLVK